MNKELALEALERAALLKTCQRRPLPHCTHSMSLKVPFPNPMTEDVLAAFCHPVPTHALDRPIRIGTEIIAGNGYVCLRAHRGRWFDDEFQEASEAQKKRIESLTWGTIDQLDAGHWIPMESVKPQLFKFAPLALWAIDKHGHPTGKCHPCPIWKCGNSHPVRLSLLQLISRLPRAEVWTGPQSARQPLYFRCTGARGIIAADTLLDLFSFSILQPTTDRMDGSLVYRRNEAPKTETQRQPAALLPGQKPWPPADLSDA